MFLTILTLKRELHPRACKRVLQTHNIANIVRSADHVFLCSLKNRVFKIYLEVRILSSEPHRVFYILILKQVS